MSSLKDPRMRRLAATILVCGTALAVDRFVLGPPAPAGAAEPAMPNVAASGSAVGSAPASAAAGEGGPTLDEEPMDARRRLADRLARLGDGPGSTRPEDRAASAPSLAGAFGDPADWWRVESPVESSGDDLEDLRSRFELGSRLTAVVHASDGLGGAQINGRFVPLGGVIGGFRLIAIGSRSVILAGAGGRVVLEMDVPRIDRGDAGTVP